MILFGYLSLIITGLLLGLMGGGGSILVVPVLVYLFQIDVEISTTYSLFIIGVTAFVGALIKARKQEVDYKTGLFFALPSFIGIYFVRGHIMSWIPQQVYLGSGFSISKSSMILVVFAVIMILSARSMILSKPTPKHVNKKSLFSVAWRGLLVGGATGFVGVGGGFLIIPALVLFLQMPMATAVGTSLAIISVNSLFGFLVSLGEIQPDYFLLGKIILVSLVGMGLGLAFADRVPDKKLKVFFGYFVLILGLFVLIKNFI